MSNPALQVALSLAGFTLALGSKEVAFAWPAVVTMWALVVPGRVRSGRKMALVGAHWALLACFLALRLHLLGTWTYELLSHARASPATMARHWLRFTLGPLFYGWMAARSLPLGWELVFMSSFWRLLWEQALFWGGAVLLVRGCVRPALAMFAWQALMYLPILPHPEAKAWWHMWFVGGIGYTGLMALLVWQLSRAALSQGPRLAARLARTLA